MTDTTVQAVHTWEISEAVLSWRERGEHTQSCGAVLPDGALALGVPAGRMGRRSRSAGGGLSTGLCPMNIGRAKPR